jgi:hypothetical protein
VPDDPHSDGTDSDGDGLLDTDDPFPDEADSDADYLNDLEEQQASTDPSNPDTDGDGYLDGDEVLEATDPLDASSVIYQGGWPYNRFKDDLGAPPLGEWAQPGDIFPRHVGPDQYGDTVDLYDLSACDGYELVLLETSATWCGPCNQVASWLSGEPASRTYDDYEHVYAAVQGGSLRWVTVLTDDDLPTTVEDTYAWHTAYPNHKIMVLSDESLELRSAFYPGYPDSVLLDCKTMEVLEHTDLTFSMLMIVEDRLK